MGLFDMFKKTSNKGSKNLIRFAERFQRIFLQRVGIVNSYDDDVRVYIERGYQENPVVYSIVSTIAKNVAKAKWVVKDKTGKRIEVNLLNKPSSVPPLMIKPNPLQSWADLQESIATHFLLEGNGFVTGEYGTGINSAVYNTLYSLPSEDMQIIADSGWKGIRGYKVDFACPQMQRYQQRMCCIYAQLIQTLTGRTIGSLANHLLGLLASLY